MAKIPGLITLLAGLACLTSCGTYRALTGYKADDFRQSVQLARAFVLSETALDPVSRDLISTNDPSISYYKQAADFASYRFTWRISSNRTVRVFGDGDIRTLENARVSISKRE